MYRNFGLECGIDLFPAYNKLTKQKEQCYPDLVTISQTLATVSPKDVIIKTLERMNLVLNFVVDFYKICAKNINSSITNFCQLKDNI